MSNLILNFKSFFEFSTMELNKNIRSIKISNMKLIKENYDFNFKLRVIF